MGVAVAVADGGANDDAAAVAAVAAVNVAVVAVAQRPWPRVVAQ